MELLRSNTHCEVVSCHASRHIDRHGSITAALDSQLAGAGQQSRHKHHVGEQISAARRTKRVARALGILGRRAVPVNKLIFVHHGGAEAGLVGGNVWLHDDSPAIVRHTVSPLGRTVILVVWFRRRNVVRFAEIVPGDNLDERGLESKHLVPSISDELFADEDPVFGVEVCREPWRNGC